MRPPSTCCPSEASEALAPALVEKRSSFHFIDTIRINRVTRQERDGRTYWVKQRRRFSRAIVPLANAFFRAAGNPVVVRTHTADWQQREIGSYLLLHAGEGYHAFAGKQRSIWVEHLPGFPLESPAKESRVTSAMLAAAARELRRAHTLTCPALGDGWSHGDAHLDNFIYDSTTGRARLIDFEVAHHPDLSTPDRHADDLFVLIQSTMGYWPLKQWLNHSRTMLQTYLEGTPSEERPPLLHRLRLRLAPPTGMGRVWWSIRTDYLPPPGRNARIAALQPFLADLLR